VDAARSTDAGAGLVAQDRPAKNSDAAKRPVWKTEPMNPRKKTFARLAHEIQPLAKGYGGCFATDEITVKGRRVGYAYREAPDHDVDSGWRFTAGDESDEYMDDADNLGIYDVNTIANYDPDIIPLLESGVGSQFARDPGSGKFVQLRQGRR
jgi:hypothetical protein